MTNFILVPTHLPRRLLYWRVRFICFSYLGLESLNQGYCFWHSLQVISLCYRVPSNHEFAKRTGGELAHVQRDRLLSKILPTPLLTPHTAHARCLINVWLERFYFSSQTWGFLHQDKEGHLDKITWTAVFWENCQETVLAYAKVWLSVSVLTLVWRKDPRRQSQRIKALQRFASFSALF